MTLPETTQISFSSLVTLETWAGCKVGVLDEYYLVKKDNVWHYFIHIDGSYVLAMTTTVNRYELARE